MPAGQGNVANMTFGELAKAKPDNGQMVVIVMKHKTLTSLGSAHLVLSPTICKWKQASLTFMRNKIPGAETGSNDHVFISSTGNTMSSSMVSAQLNSFWQKATDKVLVRVNAVSNANYYMTVVKQYDIYQTMFQQNRAF